MPKGSKVRKAKSKKVVATAKPEVLDPSNSQDEEQESLEPIVVSEDGSTEVLPAEVVLGELEVAPADSSQDDEESDQRGIVRYDALSAYLREINRYPHLTKEEETALAIKYHKNKDLEAAYKLVSSNLWLVVKIAREYERAARTLLDIVQEGNIGLLEAVKNFDPYRGVRFPSYAVWWIRAYIIRFVIANWRLVKIGTTQAQRKLFFNLKKEKDRLEREGIYPGPKLIADNLNVKEHEVVEMEQRLSGSDLSVDTPMSDESDGNLLSILPSHQPSAEELVSKKQLQDALSKGLDDFATTLNEKELLIFRERLLGEEKATLHDIAEKLKLSKERVRQIEERIKLKLKSYLVETLGDSIGNVDYD